MGKNNILGRNRIY